MTSVLFATAELRPLVRVGGLAEAAAGLVKELLATGQNITVVVPDYGPAVIEPGMFFESESWNLDVPAWAGPVRIRRGHAGPFTDVILIDRPGMARPHPYVDPHTGEGWADNDERFWAFSAAIAALAEQLEPDVLHLNDWHTAGAVGFLNPAGDSTPPVVLTIHTLGYQGVCDSSWMARVPHEPWRFAWYDSANPLVGAIRSADRIIAVSPNYATEILTPEHGMGMHEELARRGDRLVGIRNGIDVSVWNPQVDDNLPATYSADSVESGKAAARAALLERFSGDRSAWADPGAFILGVVTRLVDQKGIDHIAALAPYLDGLGARLVVLGSGTAEFTSMIQGAVEAFPDRVAAVTDSFDEPLAHMIFAGSDLFLMPSRFEPCGLAQMQAMSYGTPTVATAVGGLVDTIVDADADPVAGSGFLTRTNDLAGFVDAVHRGVRAAQTGDRLDRIIANGMLADWSWVEPAKAQAALYSDLISQDS